MNAWREDVHHRIGGEKRADRIETAAERLSDRHSVGPDSSCWNAKSFPVRRRGRTGSSSSTRRILLAVQMLLREDL